MTKKSLKRRIIVYSIKIAIIIAAVGGSISTYNLHLIQNEIEEIHQALELEQNASREANSLLSKLINQDASNAELKSLDVIATAYNAVPGQTDSSPHIMASNNTSYIGALAVSRDLINEYGLKFGDIIIIKGMGMFIVQDTMNARYTKRIDILFPTVRAAKRFGQQKVEIFWIVEKK